MKRLLRLTAIILMVNEVLTPFSYAFAQELDVFDITENIAEENETVEDSSSEVSEVQDSRVDAELFSDTQDDAQVEDSSSEVSELQNGEEDS